MVNQTEKEKVYSRQISAPILKRKSSRFGLGQFLSSGTNNSSHVATSQSLHSHHHQHLQINCAPQIHHTTHLNPTSSSAGTTPTTPNLITAQQYQQQQNLGSNGINWGAPGRWSSVHVIVIFLVVYEKHFQEAFLMWNCVNWNFKLVVSSYLLSFFHAFIVNFSCFWLV